MPKRSGWIWFGLTAVTLLFLGAIAFNVNAAWRGPEEWRWTYAIPGIPARHLMPVGLVAGYVVLVYFFGRRLLNGAWTSRRRPAGYLLFCMVAVPLLQVGLLAAESPDVIEQLYFRAVSAGSSGFFSVGSLIDNGRLFLTDYPTLMPTFPVHPQRYPPGLPLLFYGVRQPLALGGLGEWLGGQLRPYQCLDLTLMRIPNERLGTAVLQMLLPLWSALVILPLFGLARRTLGRRTAVWTVALYPLLPSFALWAGRWDQFFPVLTVTAWYLFVRGMMERQRLWLFLSGFVLALASFLSFGLVVMLAPIGLWALLWLYDRQPRLSWQQIGVDAVLFFLGLLFLWGWLQVSVGTGFMEIWQVSMGFHLGLARSYWTWLGYHLYDFGIFLGVPLALLCLFAFFYALLSARRKLVAVPIAFGVGVFLLNVSGTARGEVARVWLFLTPFAVMCAVWGMTHLSKRSWPAALLALVAAQLLVFNAFLRVVNTGLTAVPPRTAVYELPTGLQPLEATFGDGVQLLGAEVTSVSETAVQLTLYWRAQSLVATPYTVFNHLVTENGELVAQQDGMPQNNSLPFTCWRSGEVIADERTISLPAPLSVGTYELRVGLYQTETGVRLPVTQAAQSGADFVVVETVRVEE